MSTETDPRILQLSYSSLLQLHACPRRFQLQKLSATQVVFEEDPSSLTFAFGHLVGDGIQQVFEGHSIEQIIWDQFQKWNVDLFAENEKRAESFFLAIHAVQKFHAMKSAGFLEEWELVYYEGKPACELSFVIEFPDGFRYRGYVDAVLRNKYTGAIAVLEIKTTSFNELDEAVYKNSSQAIGYSIVLDVIFPQLSDYTVMYLPYKKKQREFELRPYTKSYLQRALWIQELVMDIETIKMYDAAGVYPMRGESCYNFYRQCEYFNLCTLSTSYLTKQISQKELDKIEETKYTVNLSLLNLLDSQLNKVKESQL